MAGPKYEVIVVGVIWEGCVCAAPLQMWGMLQITSIRSARYESRIL